MQLEALRVPRTRMLLVVVLAMTVGSAAPALAQESFTVETAVRTWFTTGSTTDTISVRGLNPLSELRWRGTDAVIVEGSAEVMWQRILGRLTVGGGRPYTGAFIDDDFLLDDRQGRFSHTRSAVDGSRIIYVAADVGYRVLEWTMPAGPGALDLFLGYQYWNEKYVSFGLRGGGPGLVEPTAVPSSTEVQTEDITWHSARLGARARAPLVGGLSARGEFMFLPYTETRRDDIHHLRTDLRQDPSFEFSASGGHGYQIDVGLTYRVWRELSVDAGYRYWRLESGTGRNVARGLTGTSVSDAEIETERYGPYLGLRYRF